jgi:O-acetyl-ADP-ribose deacetylase (regulator of RNase III)
VIEYSSGDLFKSGADVLCNAVNACGVMGRGLALAFKRKWPEMEESYKRACSTGQIVRECAHFWENPCGPVVANLLTKHDWKSPSRPVYVATALVALRRYLQRPGKDCLSVAVPALGCGLGGLKWCAVRPIMEAHLAELPNRFIIHLPESGECT